MIADWGGLPVLVTGGASFIGSHLVRALAERGARVRVADDFSSGSAAALAPLVSTGLVELVECDLRDPGVAGAAVDGMDVVFHLAADHGGRGYVETHQAGPASNIRLDATVFHECMRAGVGKVVFASSGCVYPNHLQQNPSEELYLSEELVGPPYDPDHMYGWAKLVGELTLQAMHRELGLNAASCRYFVVYGPGANEGHGLIAMIARAFLRSDPFEIWGTGEQIRNWTYIDDIVDGTILAAERIDDGTAVNLGTMERTRVIDAARQILDLTGHRAEIRTLPDMPTGPLNRVADNGLATRLLGWEPHVAFCEGLERTIEWYFETKDRDEVRRVVDGGGLVERLRPA